MYDGANESRSRFFEKADYTGLFFTLPTPDVFERFRIIRLKGPVYKEKKNKT